MKQTSSKVSDILIALKNIDNQFLSNISKKELKTLRAAISSKEMMVSRMYKKRIRNYTHFESESK